MRLPHYCPPFAYPPLFGRRVVLGPLVGGHGNFIVRSAGCVERSGVVGRAVERGLGAQHLRRRRIARLGPLVSAAARGGADRQNPPSGGHESLSDNLHFVLPFFASA